MPLTKGWYYTIYEGAPKISTKVVLVHGAGGSHLSWSKELRRIPGWRVLALDLPGHGRSQELPCRKIEEYAEKILRFLDAADVYRMVLVGHSMGAAICLQAAPRLEDRLVGMVLIAPYVRLGMDAATLEYLAHPTDAEAVHRWLRGMLFSPNTPERVIGVGMRGLEQARWRMLASDWQVSSRFQARQLEKIGCPTLLLVGAHDRLAPPRAAQQLAEKLPQASVVVIENAGHMVVLEQNVAVADRVEKFLNSLMIS